MQTANFTGFSASGWAGRTADKFQSLNAGSHFRRSLPWPAAPSCASASRPFLSCFPPDTPASGYNGWSSQSARLVSFQQLLTFDSGLSLVQDSAD